jgi:hypothetical protein
MQSSLEYLYLVPLFIVAYMIAVDKNLADYLYIRVFKETVLCVQSTILRYRLLLQLRYDTFIIKRGIVPRKFYKMAKEIRDQPINSK